MKLQNYRPDFIFKLARSFCTVRDISYSRYTAKATCFLVFSLLFSDKCCLFSNEFCVDILSSFCTRLRFSPCLVISHFFSLTYLVCFYKFDTFVKKFLISTLQILYFITTFLFSIRQFKALQLCLRCPDWILYTWSYPVLIFCFQKIFQGLFCVLFFYKSMPPALNPFHMAFLIWVFAICPLILRSSKTSRGWHYFTGHTLVQRFGL